VSDPLPQNPQQNVLHYATPDADGTPEWVTEAEAMLDQRCKPKQLRSLFRKADDAMKYFLKSMRRRFGVDQLGSACENCNTPCTSACAVLWVAEIPFKTFEFRIASTSPKAQFVTYHVMCPTCHAPWKRSARWQRGVRWLTTGVWVGLIVLLIVPRQVRPGTTGLTGWWLLPSVFVAMLLLKLLLFVLARASVVRGIGERVPRGLKFQDISVLGEPPKHALSPTDA
jgi:hypothetical protein